MTAKRMSFLQLLEKAQRPMNRSKPLQLQRLKTSRLLDQVLQKLCSQCHRAQLLRTKVNQTATMQSTLWLQISSKRKSQSQIAISGCVSFIATLSCLPQDFTRIRTGYSMPAKSKDCWRKQTLMETTSCSLPRKKETELGWTGSSLTSKKETRYTEIISD